MTKEKLESKKIYEDETKTSNSALSKFIFVLLFLAVASGFAWYFYKYQNAKQEINFLSSIEGQQKANKQEVEEILKRVGQLILLPKDEMPTMATIEDAQTLASEQAFFENAQNGDKVLIYSNKALVYSPARNLLVNVGPVYFQNQAVPDEENVQNIEPIKSPAELSISLDIRNGSHTQGVAKELADSLLTKGNYAIANLANASNLDYSGMILVNLRGKDVSVLEQELGVTAVTELPAGETPSSADMLIIIGNK